MKPLFTIHEGEFLVGDFIQRKLGRKYDVWVPTKDSGVDLLVTTRGRKRSAVAVQVKFSRDFGIQDPGPLLGATGWFTLDPRKIRRTRADVWVFVILTLRHEAHYVVIPSRELQRKIPRGAGRRWFFYLYVTSDGRCLQTRGLGKEMKHDLILGHRREAKREFTAWLDRWELLG